MVRSSSSFRRQPSGSWYKLNPAPHVSSQSSAHPGKRRTRKQVMAASEVSRSASVVSSRQCRYFCLCRTCAKPTQRGQVHLSSHIWAPEQPATPRAEDCLARRRHDLQSTREWLTRTAEYVKLKAVQERSSVKVFSTFRDHDSRAVLPVPRPLRKLRRGSCREPLGSRCCGARTPDFINTAFASLADGTAEYSYDLTDQLIGADYNYQDDEDYTYDANGNRTFSGYVTGDNNLVLSDGTYDYEYDSQGNRTRRTHIATGDATDYHWDHRNRLTKVVSKDSIGTVTKTVEYTYDVFNRRVAKTVAIGTNPAAPEDISYYIHDGERWERGNAGDHLALVFDGNGDLTNRYLHGRTQRGQVHLSSQISGILRRRVRLVNCQYFDWFRMARGR